MRFHLPRTLHLHSRTLGRWAFGAVTSVVILACGGSGGEPTKPASKVRVARVNLTPLTPDSVRPGNQIFFSATVLDSANNTLVRDVTFSSSNPSVGTVTNSGEFTAGTTPGTTIITATSEAVTSAGVTVRVRNVHGIPIELKLIRLPGLLPAGAVDSATVKVVDQYGDGVPGIPIRAMYDGCQRTGTDTVLTVADGTAKLPITMRTDLTSCGMVVLAPALPYLVLGTTATLGPLAYVSLTDEASSTRYQSLGVGRRSGSFVQALVDIYGNRLASTIPLISRDSTVVAPNASGNTFGGKGGQAFIVLQREGKADSVLVGVAPAGGMVFGPAMPNTLLDVSTDIEVPITAHAGSSVQLGSATIVIEWDPTLLTFLSDVATTPSGLTVINTTEASTGRITLSYANGAPSTDELLTLRRLQFHVTSVAGQGGTVRVTVRDAADATFADILSRSTMVSYPFRTR